MMRELTAGDHDQRVIAFFAARGQEAFSESLLVRSAPAAAPAAVIVALVLSQVVAGELSVAPVPPSPPLGTPVVQVSGVVAGSIDNGGARRPAPTLFATKVLRLVVMVKSTPMKRLPMAFSSS